jgi:hypothetical protein
MTLLRLCSDSGSSPCGLRSLADQRGPKCNCPIARNTVDQLQGGFAPKSRGGSDRDTIGSLVDVVVKLPGVRSARDL